MDAFEWRYRMRVRGATPSARANLSSTRRSTDVSAARSYFETVACRMPARRASSAWDHPFLRRASRMRSARGLMVAQHRHVYALAQRYASAYNDCVTDRELVTLTAAL